tara:strand:+ start:12847 stop:14013 length:1167 start_codon:yes stop_codon:yes gene_type:complete
MSKFEFKKEDIYVNRTKTYPDYKIFVNDTNVTINNQVITNVSSAVSSGYESLYEYNFDTRFGYIHPFIIGGENTPRQLFRSTLPASASAVIFNSQNPNWAQYSNLLPSVGQQLTSSYLSMTASLKRESPIGSRKRDALINISKDYYLHSAQFAISSTTFNEDTSLINIPQTFFGSAIKKGSVELNFYVTGTLFARATDAGQNGELRQTADGIKTTGSGSVVGLVFYNHGLMMLTSSAQFYTSASLNRWVDFATGLHDGSSTGSGLEERSFEIKYKGTNYVNTLTMFCHAKAGELNSSNNPTALDWSSETTYALSDTGSTKGFEERSKAVKSVVSSSIENLNEDFKKTTYISKINMYDDKGNLIGVASMAQPIKKEENDDYTFKIELDT